MLNDRPAVHAGTFYPAEGQRVHAMADALLADAKRHLPSLPAGAAVGLLVPHASLEYSGATAALGWAVAQELRPTTVVLIGTDHGGRSRGIVVWTGGGWTGPFGQVLPDIALARRIAALGPMFRADHAPHLAEYSIEVQLPLMIRACPRARIVALLAGAGDLAAMENAGIWIGRLLAGLRAAGESVLLVASSDLAHFPPAAAAEEIDRRIIETIKRLDAPGLATLERDLRAAGLPGLVCGLCGLEAVYCTLVAAVEMGATHGVLLGTANSADSVMRDVRRTVGYASVAFLP